MTVSHRAKRVTLRMGTEADRDTLYRLRHAIYGQELRQHALNEEQRLRDSLDAFNTYFVACVGSEIVGFISVTPPCHESYSIDKYVDRTQLPFAVDDHLFELRLLTVLPEHRHSAAAFLLMYAAAVWVWSQGGTRIVAIGLELDQRPASRLP